MTEVHTHLKKVETKDGSFTLHNSEYDETLHSTTGATEETIKKFIEPSAISRKAESGSINILDIGFGTGMNSAAAIDAALRVNPSCKITIVGLEKDKATLEMDIVLQFKSHSIIAEAKKTLNYQSDQITVDVIVGNALESIKTIATKFDIVLLDAFSPPKNPELWSKEFLGDVATLCNKGASLTTYSCARLVRDNLRGSGFRVEDGPKVGRRGPSTVAFIN